MFRDSKNDFEDKTHPKSVEDEEKEGFFRNLFKEKIDNRRNNSGLTDNGEISNSEEKCIKTAEEEDKERFFRKFFKDVFEDRKDANGKIEENASNGEEEEASDVPLLQRLFRVHPEDAKSSSANENESSGGLFESSPGTQKFFGKLFRDHDRSIEDSELLGLKKQKEKCPGSPQRQSENSNSKPPLPNHCTSQFRKGAYHESLDFVHTLCETSFVLVDVFPIEDRKSALCESLTDINLHIAEAQKIGAIPRRHPIPRNSLKVVFLWQMEMLSCKNHHLGHVRYGLRMRCIAISMIECPDQLHKRLTGQ